MESATFGGTAGKAVDVRAVRTYVQAALTDGDGIPDGDVGLMASELATNAVRYTATGRTGGELLVRIVRGRNRVRVEFRDDGMAVTLPRMKTDAELAADGLELLGGRGLRIVDELAEAWGVELGPEPVRQGTVWFEVQRPPFSA